MKGLIDIILSVSGIVFMIYGIYVHRKWHKIANMLKNTLDETDN